MRYDKYGSCFMKFFKLKKKKKDFYFILFFFDGLNTTVFQQQPNTTIMVIFQFPHNFNKHVSREIVALFVIVCILGIVFCETEEIWYTNLFKLFFFLKKLCF